MTANVSIITQKQENVLCVPTLALKFTPVTKGEIKRYENQGVWIMKKGRPTRFDVQTGASDDTYTEIKSSEIQEGDKVIVGSGKDAKNGKNGGKPLMRMF